MIVLYNYIGWATAATALQFLMFITFLPTLIWMAQISYNKGISSRCPGIYNALHQTTFTCNIILY